MSDISGTWESYRGRSATRLLLGFLVLASCVAVGFLLFPDHAGSWLVTGVVGFVAALIHPMALVGWLTIAILSFDVIDIDFGSRPSVALGVVLTIVGLVATMFRNRRGVPYLTAIAVTWLGFLLIHPLIFVLLGVVPMAMIYANRWRVLRTQPDRIESGPMPSEWVRPIREIELEGGLRYIGTLYFHQPAGPALAAVFRLADGRGLAIALEQWLVTHRFGSKVLFTTSSRWTMTLPGELGQLAPSHDLVSVVRTQRRVLARLLRSGIRPDRLEDDEALAALVSQFERDVAARRHAGPMTVLRAMVDEELDVRRTGGQGLLDSAAGINKLEEWATA